MTKHWGPLGWMTLHSISLNYPAQPSAGDKQILGRFMEKFIETISCPSCQSHFQGIYKTYTTVFPQWNSNKFQLFLFIVRAHNTVNKRLDKPLIRTVADCLATIRKNTQNTSLKGYRQAYMNYLITNWNREFSGEGRIRIGATRELQKLNNEYWSLREVDLDTLEFPEGDVLFNIEDRSSISRASPGITAYNKGSVVSVGFKIRGGRLTLGNM